MTDNGNDFTGLNYDLLVEDTLRLVVRSALKITEQSGLIGETHFYISFQTGYQGVEMDDALRAQHPETITIVIQHQFADLVVEDDRFSITLFFGGKPSMMTIPYDAMTQFKDPSVGFELYFNNKLSEAETGLDDDAPEAAPADGPVDGMPAETAEVVSLDSFRKSPS